MIVDEVVTGIPALIIAYLLGSIPSAYLITRAFTGRDIRRLGGGNVGGLNVLREVGILPAALVLLADLAKGAAAVSIALWGLNLPPLWVMLSGIAAIAGHNWMLFLKFSGGKGMGVTFGTLCVLLPAYGYPLGLAWLLAVILVPLCITRNVALSMGIGLLALPLIIWLGTRSGTATAMSALAGVVIAVKFAPTAIRAWSKSTNRKEFIFERWERKKKAD